MHAMQQCWVHATHLDVVPLIPQLHHTLPKTFVSGLLPCTSRRVRGKAHAGRQGRHLQWSTSCTDVGLMTANCFHKCCDVRSPLAMMKSLRVAALLPLDPPIPVRLKAVPQFGNGWRTSPPGKCRTAICQSSKKQCKSDEDGSAGSWTLHRMELRVQLVHDASSAGRLPNTGCQLRGTKRRLRSSMF